MRKIEAFALMRRRNIVKAVCHYSGGNDEGSVDQITCTLADGSTWDLPSWGGKPDEQELADLLSEPVYDQYGTFAGDFSCYGTVTWDVSTGEVVMDDNLQQEYAHQIKTL
jgi:hypothetical protein